MELSTGRQRLSEIKTCLIWGLFLWALRVALWFTERIQTAAGGKKEVICRRREVIKSRYHIHLIPRWWSIQRIYCNLHLMQEIQSLPLSFSSGIFNPTTSITSRWWKGVELEGEEKKECLNLLCLDWHSLLLVLLNLLQSFISPAPRELWRTRVLYQTLARSTVFCTQGLSDCM